VLLESQEKIQFQIIIQQFSSKKGEEKLIKGVIYGLNMNVG
jgi:hypothetical protein